MVVEDTLNPLLGGSNLAGAGGQSWGQPTLTAPYGRPAIRRLGRDLPDVLLSVDTWKAAVAAAALEAGANLINDVGAMRRDPEMRQGAAPYRAPIVVMHSQASTEYQDLMA